MQADFSSFCFSFSLGSWLVGSWLATYCRFINKFLASRCYNTLSGVAILQGLRASTGTNSACRSGEGENIYQKYSLNTPWNFRIKHIPVVILQLLAFLYVCYMRIASTEAEISKKNCTFSFTKIKRTIAIRSYGTHTYMMMLLSRYEGCVTS